MAETHKHIIAFILELLLCWTLPCQQMKAQEAANSLANQEKTTDAPTLVNDSLTIFVPDTVTNEQNSTSKPIKYVSIEEDFDQHQVFFQGFTLSVDIFNALLYAISDYGAIEGSLRLNLKNTYFPIFEMGYGRCTKEDYNTLVKYHTAAPYARIGVDWNVLKNKFQDNRLYVGIRYGFSRFNYDISGPEMEDPIWSGSEAFSIKGIKCTSHWAELVFGAEAKVYKNFHMGWTVRYKKELGSSKSDYSKPSCIPGYGYTTKSSCWGGSYSLIFDLNWGKKRSHRPGLQIEVKDMPPRENVRDMKDGKETKAQDTDDGNGTK